jgi:hypothetical protein
MIELVPIALFGWLFIVPTLFSVMHPRRALLVAFIGAWLFLPVAAYPLPGLPDLTKITATTFGAMLGLVFFDASRLMAFRFKWIDLPMIAWCLVPLPSSIFAGLGAYDGVSGIVQQCAIWGLPYLLGRLYFNTPEAVRELVVGIFIGGLIYAPFCLWEIRMSPQLHNMVYGYHPSRFVMTIRLGGYRPMVFMQHGLMLGMWMTAACLCGAWLWFSGLLKRVQGIPMSMLVPFLFGVTLFCRSTGALGLLIGALGLLFGTRFVKSPILVAIALTITPGYVFLRASDAWDGSNLVELAKDFNEERAASLEGRLKYETILARHAAEQFWFGWGSGDDWRVKDDEGRDITVSDGMWIITYGRSGAVGLTAYTLALLFPVMILVHGYRTRYWHTPLVAPAAVLAVIVLIYSMDNLLNAMVNPVFMLGAGSVSGFYLLRKQLKPMLRTGGSAMPRGMPPPMPHGMRHPPPPNRGVSYPSPQNL